MALDRLLRSAETGFWEALSVTASESTPIAEIMKQYASLRPQFADAMLVYLASRESILTIFTLDRRDFSVYRNARKQRFHVLPE
jgi:uncharacterized protein